MKIYVSTQCPKVIAFTDSNVYQLLCLGYPYEYIAKMIVAMYGDGHYEKVAHIFNPLVLNYLDDDTTKELVYVYDGEKSFPFFSLECAAKKLDVMGPGEVIADTDLPYLPQ